MQNPENNNNGEGRLEKFPNEIEDSTDEVIDFSSVESSFDFSVDIDSEIIDFGEVSLSGSEAEEIDIMSPLVLAEEQKKANQEKALIEDRLSKLRAEEAESVDNIDSDATLMDAFTSEAQTLIPKISDFLEALRGDLSNQKLVHELHRDLHTLKGNAKMIGAERIGTITHHMESLMEDASMRRISAGSVIDILIPEFEKVKMLYEEVVGGGSSNPMPVIESNQNVNQQQLKVNIDLIDKLVNEASEIRLTGATLQNTINTVKKSLELMNSNVKRLSSMMRDLQIETESQMMSRKEELSEEGQDFDPLEFDRFTRSQELARFLVEGIQDLVDIQSNLEGLRQTQEATVLQQEQLSSDMQQLLMNVRLVKFSAIDGPLHKIAKKSSVEVGKKVSFFIKGEEVEIDRGVLERIRVPLDHLLRNSIAHGIETPEERLSKGKEEAGNIILTVKNEGNFVSLTLQDDGAGLNTEKVRQKGIEKGLIKDTDILDDNDLINLMFMPGFSTADQVSQISGRGVGMDVVKSDITALGGQIQIKTERHKGMEFKITLPVALATQQAVMVEAGEQLWAIPADIVDDIKTLTWDQIEQAHKQEFFDNKGEKLDLYYLPRLLGDLSAQPEKKVYNNIILLSHGEQKIALHVEKLLGTNEIVVKNIGQQLLKINGLLGAMLLGTGDLGVIINPVLLSKRGQAKRGLSVVDSQESGKRSRLVMVVDDSLVIRKATSKFLTRYGYEVLTATDGENALEVLQDNMPMVMLVDVEMPRMDGFELTKNIRANPKFKEIPIIMITSRTADKHKNHALSLGVNVYLGKPYKEDELLIHVSNFVDKKNNKEN